MLVLDDERETEREKEGDKQLATGDNAREDILFLNHDSSIFRHASNPVCGSWKSQATSPWAKQQRA